MFRLLKALYGEFQRNKSYTKKASLLGLSFFGGEISFTAEIVYLQSVGFLDCETTFRAKIA